MVDSTVNYVYWPYDKYRSALVQILAASSLIVNGKITVWERTRAAFQCRRIMISDAYLHIRSSDATQSLPMGWS